MNIEFDNIFATQRLHTLRRCAFLTILLIGLSPDLFAYEMPIGIPRPTFGIDDSHRDFAGRNGYLESADGPYTHYVDNTHSNCSNSGDGSPERPRCDIPTNIDAGDIIEIHGGPYSTGYHWELRISGTESNPVYIRGVDDGQGFPIMKSDHPNGKLHIDGSYVIVEQLNLAGLGFRLGTEAPSRFLVGRDLEVSDHVKTCVNLAADNSMILRSHLHHCKDPTLDRHGVQVNSGVSNVWILDNHIHHNSGNGIQYTHKAESNPPDNVFVGRNEIHSDREVGISTKWVRKTVVSSNTIYGYRPSTVDKQFCFDDQSGCMTPASGGNGPGISIGSDGYPEEKWIIYNTIYDSEHCIRNEEAVKVRIIGNVCANIQSTGINLEKRASDMYIVNNTFYNVGLRGGIGVINQAWRDQFTVQIHNNLILDSGSHSLWFRALPIISTMVFENNLMWDRSRTPMIRWRSSEHYVPTSDSLNSIMASDVASMKNNRVSDPGIAVAGSRSVVREQFTPTTGSPAADAGNDVLTDLDRDFRSTFGQDVSIIHPAWQDASFDIGALPSNAVADFTKPKPPVLAEE